MPLIIEDGSIVANANSYVTVQEIRDYAALRGESVPVDDADVEVLAIKAMDYLEAQNWRGEQVEYGTQDLEWPRKDVYIRCELYPDNAIPVQLKNAQCELAVSAQTQSLLTDGSQRNVKREKVQGLETEYGSSTGQTSFKSGKVNRFLRELLQPLGVVRI